MRAARFAHAGLLCPTRGFPSSCSHRLPPVPPGECLVTGQSHFKSFDNRYFTFSGVCQYLLAQDCQDHTFSVVIETVQVSWPAACQEAVMGWARVVPSPL